MYLVVQKNIVCTSVCIYNFGLQTVFSDSKLHLPWYNNYLDTIETIISLMTFLTYSMNFFLK